MRHNRRRFLAQSATISVAAAASWLTHRELNRPPPLAVRRMGLPFGHLLRDGAFADIAAFVEISAERYDTVVGGKKGNVTLYSFDGQYKIQRDISQHLRFDEGILAAKALIQTCLDEWTAGGRSELKALVAKAFEVDAEGNLSTNRILGLRRVHIEDARWKQAMEAIGDALQIIGSKAYFRIYKRVGDSDKYEPISLNIAAL